MLSTVTYALSKKYTDKAVEAAADVAVDKAVDAAKEAVEKATDGVVDKAVDRVMENITPELTELSADVDQCHERINEDKDFVETVSQGYGRYLLDFKGLRQYIDEEQNPKYTGNGERYIVNDAVRRVVDEDYKCKVFDVFGFKETEYVFDAYCKDIREPIAILCLYTSDISDEIPLDQCVPIYATKVGPVDKTIILDRLRWEFPTYGLFLNGCRIILNSYQSEPILYHHKFDKVNVYTKDETDAAIRNEIYKEKWYVDAKVTYLDNRIGGLRDLNQYTDEERSASTTFSGKKFIFNDGVLIQVADENYQCKMYYNLEFFLSNEWVFDAYCNDINVPVAIVCKYGSNGTDYEHCEVLYADKVGPIDKSIILSRGASGPFDTNRCTVILNSYQSEPVLYSHEFSGINVYTKDETDAATDAAIENVSQSMDALSQDMSKFSEDVNELSEQLDTVKADMSIIDKKTDASNSWSEKRCGFSNDKLALIDDENYQCKLYYGYDIADNEWVFDAYCNDVNIPVAILCRQDIGDSQDLCIPIYATKVGPVNKTISITQESTGSPNDWVTIIINSYQSEPTLYQHRLDVYTREGTDAAIANAINSAITNVINTAY